MSCVVVHLRFYFPNFKNELIYFLLCPDKENYGIQ